MSVKHELAVVVRQHRRRYAMEKLEAKLLEGLNSDPPIEADQKFWTDKQKDLIARDERRRRATR